MALLIKAIDEVRAQGARELKEKGYDAVLTKTRWLLLKRQEKLTHQQAWVQGIISSCCSSQGLAKQINTRKTAQGTVIWALAGLPSNLQETKRLPGRNG